MEKASAVREFSHLHSKNLAGLSTAKLYLSAF